MRLQLQNYDLEIKYKPGKELLIAEALSRNYLQDKNYLIKSREFEAHVGFIISNLNIPNDKLKEFQVNTEKDETLKIVKNYIISGWPECKELVINSAKPFHKYKHELFVAKNLILKNNRLIIPEVMRKDFLQKVH